jgi:hypothetical protein
MSSNYKTRIERVFDLLTERQSEVENDPELVALHTEASRHFHAALEYQRKDCLDFNADYELEQVTETLETFKEVKDYDKGI